MLALRIPPGYRRSTMRAPTLVMLLVSAVVAAAAQFGCAPQAAEITGSAKVIDGDSLKVADVEIRLFGIDAPEGRQDCRRNNQAWRCGEDAATKLRALVQGATLRCTPRDTDDYGRKVSVCKNGSTDINAEMVRAGLALAYRRYSNDYVDEENEARTAKRGLWAGEFTAPWGLSPGVTRGNAEVAAAASLTPRSAGRRHRRHATAKRAVRDQGQHQPARRPDLPPAGVGFVRHHGDQRARRRTLVLLRSRSARRRLACPRRA